MIAASYEERLKKAEVQAVRGNTLTYVCMHVCIYVCMCTNVFLPGVHTYIYVSLYKCSPCGRMYSNIHVCINACMHTFTYLPTYVRMHVSTDV